MTSSELIQKRIFAKDLAESIGLTKGQLPSTTEEVDKVDEALARELGKLSMDDHERALFDLHGIDTWNEEADDTTTKLSELQQELALIPKKEKVAYERAKALARSYVENEAFQLMFLRAERFEAKQAAHVMVHHFLIKEELFVSDSTDDGILVRDITWSDLGEADRSCAMSGFLQVCPSRDAAGRTVLFASPALIRFDTIENLARASWYITMSLLNDEETQKKGIVKVMYHFREKPLSMASFQKIRRMQVGIPLPIVSEHSCFGDRSFQPVVSTFRLLCMGDSQRCRIRSHIGDRQKIRFDLQTFGIPIEDSPLQGDGSWTISWHLEWLEMQQTIERKRIESSINRKLSSWAAQSDDTLSVTILPRRFDVLFGKKKHAREHTGNLRCQHLVDMHAELYDKPTSSRRLKTMLTERIVDIIHESNGRFLKWEKGVWVEVDDDAARDKVSHYFRARRSHQSDSTKSSSSSDTVNSSEAPSAPKREQSSSIAYSSSSSDREREGLHQEVDKRARYGVVTEAITSQGPESRKSSSV